MRWVRNHVQAEHLGIGGERGAHLAGQVFAQVVGVEEALLRLVAEEQDLPGETLAVLEGIHEIALDAQRLQFPRASRRRRADSSSICVLALFTSTLLCCMR